MGLFHGISSKYGVSAFSQQWMGNLESFSSFFKFKEDGSGLLESLDLSGLLLVGLISGCHFDLNRLQLPSRAMIDWLVEELYAAYLSNIRSIELVVIDGRVLEVAIIQLDLAGPSLTPVNNQIDLTFSLLVVVRSGLTDDLITWHGLNKWSFF